MSALARGEDMNVPRFVSRAADSLDYADACELPEDCRKVR